MPIVVASICVLFNPAKAYFVCFRETHPNLTGVHMALDILSALKLNYGQNLIDK
jgi:hypothetical protein